MSQTLHQIYQSKAIVVARTMVVKFHSIALAINEVVREAGYPVDEDNPASWKYYMNMFGEYHQYDHDRLFELTDGESRYIQIKVAGETAAVDANFSKDLLFGETADQGIANEYRFNTQYYKQLVNKYPEFEDLILGVLNPVSPELSLPADDGEVLYCGGYLRTKIENGDFIYVRQDYGPITDNYLIESNEENLIYILRDHISNYIGRWWNINYIQTHDLFLAQFVALMTLTIPQILGNIRLLNARTPFVHSFFVRQHLESMGKLGWVCEYLSKEVLLWLHRNVRWLDANRGKTKAFRAIIDNVLTPSNVKIAGFKLRHDVSRMDEDNLYPEAFMEKIPLNYVGSSITRNEIIDVILAEVQLAIENKYNQEGQAKEVADLTKYDIWDDLYTRVLESTMELNNTTEAVTREDIAMNMWLYTASHGLYRGTVIFTNPFTNERIQLTPLNAYILTFYCFNVGYANYVFDEIPDMFARLVTRHTRNTPGEAFPTKPTLEEIRYGTTNHITDDQVREILGDYVPLLQHSSTVTFAEEVTLAYEEALRKYMACAIVEDAYGRGQADWVRHHCYWYDIPCPLTTTPTKYSNWLLLNGFNFNGYTHKDFVTLGISIVEAATGVDLNAIDKLKNTQAAILSVLRHFASYTVQIIQNNSNTEAIWLDNKTIRITNMKGYSENELKAKLPTPTVRPSGKMDDGPLFLNVTGVVEDIKVKEVHKQRTTADVGVGVSAMRTQHRIQVKLPGATIVGADIPDIVIDNRVPLYTTLTSSLYPMYFEETLATTADLNPTFYYLATTQKVIETIDAQSTISDIVVHPHIVNTVEEIDSFAAINLDMVLVAPIVKVVESLESTANINSVFTLLTPVIPVSDSLNATANVTKLFLLPEPKPITDSLESTANIVQAILADPLQLLTESLSSTANIKDIALYYDGKYEFNDRSRISVELRKGYVENDTVLGTSEITHLTYVEKPIINDGDVEEE